MPHVHVRSPINIAIVKYWGKSNEDLILPLNNSISLTLDVDQIYSETIVKCFDNHSDHTFILNGQVSPVTKRMLQVIQRAQKLASEAHLPHANWTLEIRSDNNFPTAAGMASSASGLSAFAVALGRLYQLPQHEIAILARLGSGSACRSVFGGIVEWSCPTETNSQISEVLQVYPAAHWPELRVLICQVSQHQKALSSTVAMQRTVATSQLHKHRVQHLVPQHCARLKEAFKMRDFESFAEVTMRESNQLHAVCLDTFPPVMYLSHHSILIQNWVHRLNERLGRTVVAYSFDAGPNAFLFCLKVDQPLILRLLCECLRRGNDTVTDEQCNMDTDFIHVGKTLPEDFELPTRKSVLSLLIDLPPKKEVIERVICCQVGNGPVVVEEDLGHK